MNIWDTINPWGALRAAREHLALERVQAAEAANIRSQRVEAAELRARLTQKELSDAQKMLEATAHGLAQATKKNALLTYDIRALRDELDCLKGNYENLQGWCDRYAGIIAKGHFRNPENGRIGPIGKVYE